MPGDSGETGFSISFSLSLRSFGEDLPEYL
jgi:hypothetical protein